ncbi:MAG: hypothetical protein ACX94A_08330, partial [Algiphilus sp.]
MYRRPFAQHRTQWAIGLLMVLLSGAVQAQTAPSVLSVEHVALGTNAVRITVALDGPAPEPRSFFVEQPARLSIDLPQTGIAPGTKRVHPINIGATRSLALAEAQGR